MWNSQNFYVISIENKPNRQAILPLIFKSLHLCRQSKNDSISTMATNILGLYQDLDPELYQSLLPTLDDDK